MFKIFIPGNKFLNQFYFAKICLLKLNNMKSMFYSILKVPHCAKASTSNFQKRFIVTVNNVHEFLKNSETPLTQKVIEEKLLSLSVDFNDGYTCFHVKKCNLCCKKKGSSNFSLFVNKKTGFFLCQECNISGSWSTFVQCLEKERNKNVKTENNQLTKLLTSKKEEDLKNWKNIVNISTSVSDLDDYNYNEILKDFNLNFCRRYDVENIKTRVCKDNNFLYFPIFLNNLIVGYKIFSKDGKSTTYPTTECSGIISTNKKVKTAVVVAEMQDFFALAYQDLNIQILCLPYGVSVLPQSCLPALESYEKIILWLGGIETLDITINFASKLNKKRCHIVKPINNQKSAQHAVSKKEDICNILSNSKSTWNEYIVTFNSLRDEILSQLQNKDQCAGIPWQRFPVLTQILKGHRRGELTILTGPTGSGKTTFISEYSLDLAIQGVNTLWGSFEIKNSHLAKKMLQQFARIPLESHIEEFDNLANKFEKLPIFFMSFHGQQHLNTVMDAVEHCSYVYDIGHVIIDNVQFMIDIEPDSSKFDRFYKQDVIIQKFRKFATEHNCHVTLIMHPRKGINENDLSINSIFGGVKATQEADNVLIIQSRALNSFIPKKVLQVEKNRYCGDLGHMSLDFDKSTLCFSKNSKLNKIKNLIQDDFTTYETESKNSQNYDDNNYDEARIEKYKKLMH